MSAIPMCILTFHRLKREDLIYIQAWLQRYDAMMIPDLNRRYHEGREELILTDTCVDLESIPLLTLLSRDLRGVKISAEYLMSNTSVVYEFANGVMISHECFSTQKTTLAD